MDFAAHLLPLFAIPQRSGGICFVRHCRQQITCPKVAPYYSLPGILVAIFVSIGAIDFNSRARCSTARITRRRLPP